MMVEFLYICDGTEGIAKDAIYFYLNTQQKINSDGQKINNRGLEAAGCAIPEPNLLLIFSFTQCLLGFPTWRLPYY